MLEKTIRKTYQEACEAMRQKEYQKARFYFDEVRQSAPTYRSVNYFLAKCAFVLNEAEENIYYHGYWLNTAWFAAYPKIVKRLIS